MKKTPFHNFADHRQLHATQSWRAISWASFHVVMIIVVLLGLGGRVVQLKLAPDTRLPRASEVSTSKRVELARRGHLYDRSGRAIASSTIGYRLFVDPGIVEDLTTIASDITHVIGGDTVAIDMKIHKRINTRYVVVEDLLPDWKARAIREANFRGVGLEQVPVRHYPYGDLGASVIGMVGFEQSGLSGYEYLFNQNLAPEHGNLSYLRDVRHQALWFDPNAYKAGRGGRLA